MLQYGYSIWAKSLHVTHFYRISIFHSIPAKFIHSSLIYLKPWPRLCMICRMWKLSIHHLYQPNWHNNFFMNLANAIIRSTLNILYFLLCQLAMIKILFPYSDEFNLHKMNWVQKIERHIFCCVSTFIWNL